MSKNFIMEKYQRRNLASWSSFGIYSAKFVLVVKENQMAWNSFFGPVLFRLGDNISSNPLVNNFAPVTEKTHAKIEKARNIVTNLDRALFITNAVTLFLVTSLSIKNFIKNDNEIANLTIGVLGILIPSASLMVISIIKHELARQVNKINELTSRPSVEPQAPTHLSVLKISIAKESSAIVSASDSSNNLTL